MHRTEVNISFNNQDLITLRRSKVTGLKVEKVETKDAYELQKVI